MSPEPKMRGPKPIMRPVKRKPVDPNVKKTQDASSEVKKEPKVETPKVDEVKLDSAPVVPSVSAPSEKIETKPEPKAEVKPEVKPEVKVAVKSESIETKPEVKSKPEKPAKPEKSAKVSKPKSEGGGTDFVKVASLITNVLLIGALAFFIYSKADQAKVAEAELQNTTETFKADINGKIAEINRLQDSLRIVIAEKEKLGLELSEERAKLAELDDLKAQIQNKQLSINQLNKKLSTFKKDYIMASASLQSLTAENKHLQYEKETLYKQLQEKDDSIKALVMEKEELAEKISVASALKVESINITALGHGGKELKQAPTYKAMLVQQVKMSISLAQNDLAEGKKEIYMRFIEPGGATLFEGDKTFLVNGKKTFYTDKQTLDLETSRSTGFLYMKGSRYKPGKYTIEFYCEGKKIGVGALTLTK
jgi:regulator of replication initiation timing